MNIQADGIWAILVLILIISVPIKAGAHMVSAKKTDLLSCSIAAVVGVIVGYIASTFLGSSIGGPIAGLLGFVIAIRFMLGTTIIGAISLSIVAVGVSILTTAFLSDIF